MAAGPLLRHLVVEGTVTAPPVSGFGRICNFGLGRLRSVEQAECTGAGLSETGMVHDKSALRNMYAQVYLSKMPSGFGLAVDKSSVMASGKRGKLAAALFCS